MLVPLLLESDNIIFGTASSLQNNFLQQWLSKVISSPAATPRKLLEKQIPRPYPRLTESEALGRLQHCVLTSPPDNFNAFGVRTIALQCQHTI